MPEPLAHLQGKYEILEKLREGGMGAIYKVRHLLLDEIRVIKVLRPQLRSDDRLRERFLREARTAIRVRHPNIAQLYDCVIDDEHNAFIVMEFIEGITFQEMLAAVGPPPLGLALELAMQSLAALGTIHRKGIIHRDISPDNIMFCADDEGEPVVKLIDLGIAKVLKGDGGLTETGTFLGKVRYASPEHFTGDGQGVDERSDLYSFGVVLYELVTGQRPFTGNDVASLIAAHLFRGPLDFLETDPEGRVPDTVRGAILTALAKEPQQRFQTASQFRGALRELAGEHSFTTEDVERALARQHEIDTMPMRARKPGSTQAKLDRQFGVGATPAPETSGDGGVDALQVIDETLKTPPPQAVDPLQLQSVLAAAESLLRLGRYDEARLQLDVALRLKPTSRRAQKMMRELEQAQPAKAAWMEEIDALLLGEQAARGKPAAAKQRRSQPVARASRESNDRQKTAQELRAAAAALLQSGRADEAAAQLEQALMLQPENGAIRELLAEANAAVHRHRRQEEDEKIAAVGMAVEKELQAGRLEMAEAALNQGIEALGEHEAFSTLRLQMEQEKARRATVEAAVAEARGLLDSNRPAEAIAALAMAQELAPDDGVIGELIADCETRRLAIEAEQETLAARATFESQLQRGDLDGAALTLGALEERLSHAELERLRSQLEGAHNRERAGELVAAGTEARAAGRLDEAVQRLGQALTLSPDDARVNELFEEAEAAQRQQRQLDELLLTATQTELAGDLVGAVEILERAVQLRNAGPEVADRLRVVSAQLAAAQQRARKESELQSSIEQIASELAAHRFNGAERAIEVAARVFGEIPQVVELRQRLESERMRVQEEAVAPLLAQARQSAMVEDYPQALTALRQAQRMAPEHLEVRHLIEMYDASQRARREHQRQSRELSHAVVSIEAMLSRGDLEEAERALDLAERVFGVYEELVELRNRLDGSRRVDPGDPAAAVERALRALDAGERAEAVRLLREAQSLAPDDIRVQGLLDEVMRREAEASIEVHLQQGDLERARWTLNLAIGMYGRVGRLPGLEDRIEQAGA